MFRDDPRMGSSAGDPAPYSNTVRIGYARVSGRTQDHQLQLDALADADCRDIVIDDCQHPHRPAQAASGARRA